MQAGNDVLLNASRDINLTSRQETERSRGTSSSGTGFDGGAGGSGG